jgi:hypothetical protein
MMKEFIERAEQSEANKINQAKIEIFNTPVFVVPESSPAEKPDPKNLDTGSSFLDLIEIILEIIVDTAKAISSHEKK